VPFSIRFLSAGARTIVAVSAFNGYRQWLATFLTSAITLRDALLLTVFLVTSVLKDFAAFRRTSSGLVIPVFLVAEDLPHGVNRAATYFTMGQAPAAASGNRAIYTDEKIDALFSILGTSRTRVMTGPMKAALSDRPWRFLFAKAEIHPGAIDRLSGREFAFAFGTIHGFRAPSRRRAIIVRNMKRGVVAVKKSFICNAMARNKH
jgi:hypothetical protein